MKVKTKIIFLDDNNEKFFGDGPYQLLKAIEEAGSLSSAAKSMNMAFSKAFHLIKHAEQALGFSLTEKTIGGKDGGGSIITEKGKEWMNKYEQYRDQCIIENEKLYHKFFPTEQ